MGGLRKSSQGSIFVVGWLVLSLAFSGCRVRHAGLFEDQGRKVLGDQRRMIVETLYRRASEISVLRALTTTRIEHEGEVQSFRQAFVIQRPGKLRLEVFPSQTFYTLGLVIIRSDKLTILDSEQKKVTTEVVTPRSVRKAIGIPARYDELVGLFTARIPLDLFSEGGDLPEGEFSILDVGSRYLVKRSDNTYAALIDKASMLISSVEIRDQFNEHVLLTAHYADEFSVQGIQREQVQLWHSLSMTLVRDSVSISMELRSASADKLAGDSLFEVVVPKGYSEY